MNLKVSAQTRTRWSSESLTLGLIHGALGGRAAWWGGHRVGVGVGQAVGGRSCGEGRWQGAASTAERGGYAMVAQARVSEAGRYIQSRRLDKGHGDDTAVARARERERGQLRLHGGGRVAEVSALRRRCREDAICADGAYSGGDMDRGVWTTVAGVAGVALWRCLW